MYSNFFPWSKCVFWQGFRSRWFGIWCHNFKIQNVGSNMSAKNTIFYGFVSKSVFGNFPKSVLFVPRASRSVLYCSHTFQCSSCNMLLKLKSISLYCKCEWNFLKVTKFIYDFKWKRKFNLLMAPSALKNTFSSWCMRFAIDFLLYIH